MIPFRKALHLAWNEPLSQEVPQRRSPALVRSRMVWVFVLAVFALSCSRTDCPPDPTGKENLVYRWTDVILEACARDTEKNKPRPTISSRCLALIYVSMFDAWALYDPAAKPVYTIGRKIKSETPECDKREAISYAAYVALREYFPDDTLLYRSFMQELGYETDLSKATLNAAAAAGMEAARQVIEARDLDGANQYGNEWGTHGKPYRDYTGYQPVNTADTIYNLNRWQPKYFIDPYKGRYAPECLTPHWGLVKPVVLDSASQFRPPPPPAADSEQMKKEIREVVDMQANLTDADRALVEFMRDGPRSVQQAGHWLKFAQSVAVRDNHTYEESLKLFFLVEITAMDCFIACWESKMYYDTSRPYSLIHELYGDQIIQGWGGEGQGIKAIPGTAWRPYSPSAFLCPPFPSYVSGHSTVSGGCAEALRLFTGSDDFGESATLVAGALTEPGYQGDTITIELKTFSQTADIAGKSRILGGYHIASDNKAGLDLGRHVATEAYQFYLDHTGNPGN